MQAFTAASTSGWQPSGFSLLERISGDAPPWAAAASPNQLPSATLWRLIQHLQANGLETREALFSFWSRIARSVAVLFGVLVAVPFVFGSLRAAGSGARTTFGLLIGIGFFLLQNMLESGAVVFDLDPVLLAWVPTGLLALASLVLIARTR